MHISKIYLRVRKKSWRRKWQPTPVFLPEEFQTEEPGILQSMESQKVGHNLASKQQQPDLPNIMNMSISWTSLVIQWLRIHLPMQETWVLYQGWEDLLEKEMETHSSIHAWEIPWTAGGSQLQSMGHKRVRHDLATKQKMFVSQYQPFQADTQKCYISLTSSCLLHN